LVTHEVRQFKGKYIINVYDCSNMSYDLANRLNAQGIRADIYAYDFGVTGHAVVKITYKGKEYYSDPGRQWPFIRPPKGELYWQGAPCDVPENHNEEFRGHLK
jgi:hypothetical protein